MAVSRPCSTLARQLQNATSWRTPIVCAMTSNSRFTKKTYVQQQKISLRSSAFSHRASSTSIFRLNTSRSSSSSSTPTKPKQYTFSEISTLITSPSPNRILIDVREPGELQSTGRIPTSQNAPLTSSPDFAFLPAEEFEDRFGFPKPGPDDEVIFYCKSGVRSRAAAKLAQQGGFGGVVSEYPGSWKDWDANGGEKEITK